MELELISFKLCPFVQSSVITLLNKQVDYNITYIDINDPPLWFEELSPTGQVPLVKVNGSHIIFESSVINEFLDESTGGGMMPTDPLTRAQQRAWIQFCGSILGDISILTSAADEEKLADVEYDLQEKLDRIEALKEDKPFFNGDALSLIDCIYATVFMRLDLIKPARHILDTEQYPKLHAWSDALLQLDAVQNSVVPEFKDIFYGVIKMRHGAIAQMLN